MEKVVAVRLQFHATPEELIDLARSWAAAHGLHLVAEQFFPDWRVFSLADVATAGDVLHTVDRLALRSAPFDLTATTDSQFTDNNPGALYITIGRAVENELGEAMIGGLTTDPAEADVWRRLTRKVRAETHRGAKVHNWAATGALPSHRHTTGAHRLAEKGVRMVQFLGGNEYTFDDIPRQLARVGQDPQS